MTAPILVRMSEELEEQLRRHCESQYPKEACGALYGRGDGTGTPWEITGIDASPNEHGEDRRRRYLVPPDFQLQAERKARAANLEVVGYYHSHPDHPPQPSEYDREHAWFGYLYVICAVRNGRSTDVNAFTLDKQGGVFLEVRVVDNAKPVG